MSLKNKIKKWQALGLITEEQQLALLQHEKESKSHLSYSLYGFLIVAVVSASLGVIALVAANWRIIPAFIKLTGYFLSFIALSFYIIKIYKKNPLSFFCSGFLLFIMIFCLAGIGLIAQIYNLSGSAYQTLFFWTLLTSGFMLISQGSLVFYLWFASLYTASWLYLLELNLNSQLIFKILLCQVFLLGFPALLFHNKKVLKKFPSLKFKKAVFEEGALLAGILSLILLHNTPYSVHFNESDLLLLGGCIALLFLGVFLSDYKKIQKKLLMGMGGLFFLFYILSLSDGLNKLGFMIFSVLVLSLWAFFFATLKKRSLFTFLIFAITLRILFFYLSIFKSLTVTGIVLLFSGFFIYMVVKGIRSQEQKWIKWMESLE